MRDQELASPYERAARRIRDDGLALFRGRHRACSFEWVDIEARPFPHVVTDDLAMVLRTPFQRLDLMHGPSMYGRAQSNGTYGLDVFAGKKVFSATWVGLDDLRCHAFVRGRWERTLARVAAGVLPDPGEVALGLATLRVAYGTA